MRLFTDLLADLRFTFRQLRNNVGFTAVTVCSMALGIGASSAIFSLVHAVLFDPYPYTAPERMAGARYTSERVQRGVLSYTVEDYRTIRESAQTIEDAYASDFRSVVATDGFVERVSGRAYSPNFFNFMGVPAMIGRTWGPSDMANEAAPPRIAVLSSRFWQRRYNADPAVVGKTIELNHELYTILGILPPRFTWQDVDVYLPLPMTLEPRLVSVFMRIRPGVSMEQAGAEMQVLTEGFAQRNPELYRRFEGFRMNMGPLNDSLLGAFKGTILILLSAVGCLLLIACGNVSILMLARASAREKEIAVRLALGAGRGRIIRQLLTESVVLSLAGGLLGVLLAYRGVPVMVALMPEFSVPHEAVIAVNSVCVLVSFGISVITGILFGMAPALQCAKADVREAIDGSGRSIAGGGMGKLRSALVVAEVALTMILLVGAGIAVRGLVSLIQAPLGYEPDRVIGLSAAALPGRYTTWQQRRAYFQQILERLQAVPGVESVGNTMNALPPYINFGMPFEISGRAAPDTNEQVLVGLVGGDYFSTVRVPLLRGRTFSAADLERVENFAVINEEMQRRYFPTSDPEGRRIRLPAVRGNGNPEILNPPELDDWFEIIGVVGTARNQGIENDPQPAVYIPDGIVLPSSTTFLVRTAADPMALVRVLQEQFVAVDSSQPVAYTQTLDEVLERSGLAYPRFSTTLFSVFAAIGLLLAASGLFSVLSYTVARRTHEFGIRRALGATSGDILRSVTLRTAKLLLAGIAIGLAGVALLSPIMRTYLQGWDPGDPAAFIGVILLLLAVAFLACWLPAKRATAIQPVTALRHE